ncbi:MAG: DUF934 domain-containing protein [Methylococcales bacterium]|nr:DUF934 domain-containing protein [Methylococcales bacterium]MCK5478589.1 DUF934 domain-containing protein [Methylococcales bacterium]
MKIIKDKQIIEDTWTHIADSDEITHGDITVSLSRWKKEKTELINRQGNTGVRLLPADKVEDIAEDLKQINLVALEFPVFTDGRAFSHARLLRSRYGFNGEIRAIGNYMPDQVFYLSRVGVNAFQLEEAKDITTALSTMNDFTVKYQASTN